LNINCDIGERGATHPVDLELMTLIDIANLACGGHAGSEESIASFRGLAETHQVELSAHLSYPDRKNFGRVSLNISREELSAALEGQWSRISDLTLVKFHGALYLDSARDHALATHLSDWLLTHGVQTLICPPESEMAAAVEGRPIRVLREAFIERRYQVEASGRPGLVPRSHPDASILDLSAARDQAMQLIESGTVTCIDGTVLPLQADTLCIHSDSPIALELAHWLQTLPEKHQ
jgi:UPF0271 protein